MNSQQNKGCETSINFTPRSGVNVNGMKSQKQNEALVGQTKFVRNDGNTKTNLDRK